MINLESFLFFDGNCAEAMTFYQSCLGGGLTVTKVSRTPMREQTPPKHRQKVASAHLKSGAIEFAASDRMHPTRTPRQGNTVCMYINSGRYNELNAIFDKLSEGADGALLDDLRDTLLGSYGHLTDKYGAH
jgi:PhnB protein